MESIGVSLNAIRSRVDRRWLTIIAGLKDVSDGDSERCYRFGIFEMEMYQMMDSFKPRNFLQ